MSELILVSDHADTIDTLRRKWEGALHVPSTMKEMSDLLLRDETSAVAVDVDHPGIDYLEAIRLVRGSHWDVMLMCFGDDEERCASAATVANVVPRDAAAGALEQDK